jgi:hypothetical protein
LNPKSADEYFESQEVFKKKKLKQQNNLDGRSHDLFGLTKTVDIFPCQEHFMAWISRNNREFARIRFGDMMERHRMEQNAVLGHLI